MRGWVRGLLLDRTEFARRYFGRAANDPVVDHLWQAAKFAAVARNKAELRVSTEHLAAAMQAEGLDRWRQFMNDAQQRATAAAHLPVPTLNGGPKPATPKAPLITPVGFNTFDDINGRSRQLLLGGGGGGSAAIGLGLLGLGGAMTTPHAPSQPQVMHNESAGEAGNDKNAQADAPGQPTAADGYTPPKKWDGEKVKNPNGSGAGWPDARGDVWIPTGPAGSPKAHGGPHWDVQSPGGGYRNVYPGGKIR